MSALDRLAALAAGLGGVDAARLLSRAPEAAATLARAEALAAATGAARLEALEPRPAPVDRARWSAEHAGVRRLAAELMVPPPTPRRVASGGPELLRRLLLESLLTR